MTKRLLELRDYFSLNPTKVALIGNVCSGKTTLAKLLKQVGFTHLSIDRFRFIHSDGTLFGENKAYNEFIKAVNELGSKSAVIECTGLSYRFSELELQDAFWFMLECNPMTAKFRQVERDLNGYFSPPFPYSINRYSFDLDAYMDKFGLMLDLIPFYDTELLNPSQVFNQVINNIIRTNDKIIRGERSKKQTQKTINKMFVC